jgi:AP-1-like transcription factor
MEAYSTSAPLWDSSFSHLPDDDFLALLQKQFPPTTDPSIPIYTDGINPQTVLRPLPTITPPSEDSSPSPPTVSNENDDTALKRKPSNDDLSHQAPNQKNQHTCMSTYPQISFNILFSPRL